MDFSTYWLVVPIVGNALTIPFWIWLVLTRRHDKHRKAAAE